MAARPVDNYTVKNIYCYETLSETEWAPPFGDDAFIPNHFVNVAEEITYKLEAMQCFKSQVRPFPSTRSLETIDALAKFRGATVGFNRAEAFMVIRTIADLMMDLLKELKISLEKLLVVSMTLIVGTKSLTLFFLLQLLIY